MAWIVEITCAGWHRTVRESSDAAARARVERVIERYGYRGRITRNSDTVIMAYKGGDVVTLLIRPEVAGEPVTKSLDEHLAEIVVIQRRGLITREEYIMRVADAFSDATMMGDEIPATRKAMLQELIQQLSPR